MRYLLKKVGITTAFSLLILTGCSASKLPEKEQDPTPPAHYLQLAPAGNFGQIGDLTQLQPFITLFQNLNRDSIETNLAEVYANQIYFNDTFHTFSDRNQLKKYLLGLAEASQTKVVVLDAVANGDDFLIRWSMHTRAKITWKTLDINSFGMTHVRFDEQGKIVLHQDFWDAAGGFYEHLPLLGASIKAIRSRLAD